MAWCLIKYSGVQRSSADLRMSGVYLHSSIRLHGCLTKHRIRLHDVVCSLSRHNLNSTLPKEKEKLKLKVVPVLFLTKHHAMKAYWGSGGIDPIIL